MATQLYSCVVIKHEAFGDGKNIHCDCPVNITDSYAVKKDAVCSFLSVSHLIFMF